MYTKEIVLAIWWCVLFNVVPGGYVSCGDGNPSLRIGSKVEANPVDGGK